MRSTLIVLTMAIATMFWICTVHAGEKKGDKTQYTTPTAVYNTLSSTRVADYTSG